ncbi:DNA-binding protein [Brevibacterium sp. R8603A2]|uniref:DNA-binding protein n=1 Tax=Brevibacterium sp. R8603A2 TaxID=2929779 RepID=UPI001FFA5410|nr:DNA-binding protein [Brevibacterium sp. R8603A2]MCK1801782.1 DNA-binding protein [Brevibacterium sp. R8603A2]
MNEATDIATVDEYCARYGITREAAAQERYRGMGPRFFKRGRRVYYRWADIFAWEAAMVQDRTGEKVTA